MHKLALVFPGQGSQFVGMGQALYAQSAEARALFAHADALLGLPLSRLCLEGPQAELDDTANTQPAIFLVTLALWQLVATRVRALAERVVCVAGHSLGEYAALAVSGALNWEEGLRLVRARGEAMRAAGQAAPGGMAAIIGLPAQAVDDLVTEVNADTPSVWIANDNMPSQIVIAGGAAALERALALARVRGAKRATPLAVSVACHTPLMAPAAERLANALEQTPLERPWTPVLQNTTARATSDPIELRAALLQQLTAPVRWVESIRAARASGADTFVEIGPRSVLAGLIERIDGDATVHALTDADALRAFAWED